MAIIAVAHVDEQASRSWHAHLTTCLEMRTSSVWLKGGGAETTAVVHVFHFALEAGTMMCEPFGCTRRVTTVAGEHQLISAFFPP